MNTQKDAKATQEHIKWIHGILRENGHCIDGGRCHHRCDPKGECFRQNGCVPLTGSRLNDNWELPDAAPQQPSIVGRAQDMVISRSEWFEISLPDAM